MSLYDKIILFKEVLVYEIGGNNVYIENELI